MYENEAQICFETGLYPDKNEAVSKRGSFWPKRAAGGQGLEYTAIYDNMAAPSPAPKMGWNTAL